MHIEFYPNNNFLSSFAKGPIQTCTTRDSLIAAIFTVQLLCPELLPERLVLCESPTPLDNFFVVSTKYFSLARRTTNGRPQANVPCIFSLANLASCMLTLMVEIRKCLKKKMKKQSAYLFCAILDESKASWLTAFWATSMPQKVFSYNLSKGGKHLN